MDELESSSLSVAHVGLVKRRETFGLSSLMGMNQSFGRAKGDDDLRSSGQIVYRGDVFALVVSVFKWSLFRAVSRSRRMGKN